MGKRLYISLLVMVGFYTGIIFSCPLYSQKLSLRTYDSGDGLIRSMVISVFQDSKGFLWVGTSDGVARFDGVEFHTFTTSDGLVNNYVNDIIEDGNGSLWIATAAGLSKYRDGSFTNFTTNEGLPSNSVLSLLYNENVIWIGTGNGVGKYSLHEKSLVSVNSGYVLSDRFIRALYFDSRGYLWAGTERGLYVLQNDTFKQYLPEEKELRVQIHDIIKDTKNNIWIASLGDGVFVLDQEGIRKHYTIDDGLSSDRVVDLMLDSRGYIWGGTFGGGVIRFSPDLPIEEVSREQGLPSMTVRSIIEDKEGNIWFGTHNGLSRYRNDGIVYYTSDHGLASNMVTGILQVGDAIWFGTYGSGLSILHDGDFKTITSRDGLPFDVIRNLYKTQDGTIWIATHRGVSQYIDGTFRNYSEYDGLAYDVVLSIFEGQQNDMWFGTYGRGVSVLQKGDFTTLTQEDGVGSNVVHSIVQDEEGALWFATNCGVARKNNHTRTSKYYHIEDGLPSDTVRSIYITDNDDVWFCTDRGIAIYDGHSITSYNKEDGLSDDRCRFIISDSGKNLWIGTNRGVSKFDGERFYNYNVDTGLPSNEMNTNAAYVDRDGNLWFGTTRGVIMFDPDKRNDVSVPPPVYITGVTIAEEDRDLSQPIQMQYNENNLQISFVGIQLSAPAATEYRYKLVGRDNDWNITTIGTVNYSSLPPGEYTFKVKAVNRYGIKSTKPATLSFTIAPPFWSTWWFLVLSATIIIGIAFGIHRYRIGKVLELERLRTRIASDLHDDVGSTLTKISIYSDLVHDEQDREKMRMRAKKIGVMTREVISTLSDVVWTIDARNDTVEDLISRMKEFAHAVLSARDITVSFRTNNISGKKRLSDEVRQNIFLIFKESVNNIAKHAQANEVYIELKSSQNTLIMMIQDDGIGIYNNRGKNGQGLRNMTMRAEKVGGQLQIKNNMGTNITLKAPVL